jgi:hypothetical protein
VSAPVEDAFTNESLPVEVALVVVISVEYRVGTVSAPVDDALRNEKRPVEVPLVKEVSASVVCPATLSV